MEITFTYIRNRIREHSKQDLLLACYNILDYEKEDIKKPIWFIFLLMKWTYLYGGEKYPTKPLTSKRFSNILNSITKFNEDHVSNFIKKGELHRAFHIIYSQQIYLQETVYKEKFATQLKLYNSIKSKYDISESFFTKTGITIPDFIIMMQLTWLYANIDKLEKPGLYFDGYLHDDFLMTASDIMKRDKIIKFLKLLMLDPINPNEKIIQFKRSIKREELQSLEKSFFTLYPFQYFNDKIKLIHKSILNYSINYYLYDYLKSTDEKFTTEFGLRFEKYVELGIKEINCKYLPESELKKILPKGSNIIDFHITDSNIFIECKAVELQAYPSINPTDELIYNSLKNSLIKAYFKQLLSVSKKLNAEGENWGIILTYKKLYWSQFTDLYKIAREKEYGQIDTEHLPPENVFIVDLYTWDRIVNIINDENTTLLDILKLAKQNNSKEETQKQSFDMHLDNFQNNSLNLSYLTTELKMLNFSRS